MSVCLAVPVFMMQGVIRPGLAMVMVLFGAWLLWRHARNGWRLEPPVEHSAALEET